MKLYLIGMPGSGKSTLGKQLANELLLEFVDLDTEIEQREGKKIADIFREKGEDYFRQTEAAVLREWAGSSKSFTMATGGGTPCFHHGMDVINQTGISIFLDVDIVTLAERTKQNSTRPLLQPDADVNERLKQLLEKRISIYTQAHYKIQHPDKKKVLAAINRK